MRYVMITNRTQARLGLCGTTVAPNETLQFPLAKIQDWDFRDYTDQLVALQQAGSIQVTLADEHLGLTQTLNLGAPLPADIGNQLPTIPPGLIKGKVVTLWLNGSTGDDTNDGLTESTPVKRVSRLRELIPQYIGCHYLVINIRGVLNLNDVVGSKDISPDYNFNNVLQFNTLEGAVADLAGQTSTHIIINGTTAVIVALDNGAGGNIVSDLNGVGEIGLAAATWTTNAYKGLWCDIKTGPLAGQRYGVAENDGTKLYLHNCTSDPGAGAEFVLTRPQSEITSGPFWLGQSAALGIIVNGPASLWLSNIYFSGGATFEFWNATPIFQNYVDVGRCIIEGSSKLFGFAINSMGYAYLGADYWDTDGALPVYHQPSYTERVGVLFRSDPAVACVFLFTHQVGGIFWSLMPRVFYWHSRGAWSCYGTWFKRFGGMNSSLVGHGGSYGFGHTFGIDPGPGVPVRFGGSAVSGPVSGPAVDLYDCDVDMLKSVADYGDVGIRMARSTLMMAGVSGSNNANAGVHGDIFSSVLLTAGKPVPTISGNSGTVELSEDGVTQKSTWAAIQAVAASGSITAVAKANLLDNETFVLDDGVNPAITWEFQVTGGFVPTGGGVLVIDVTALTTAAEVAAAIVAAINASSIGITAGTPTGAVLPLLNDVRGAAGNVVITDTVVDVGFTHTGMANGQDATPVSGAELICKEYVLRNGTWGL